ncbi:hypothetical protein [Paenibacillus mucilaginosus]|uniref:hypothetical protein n=1 Tax=Paenibacillus mucilaginosus TaxID=61624 RepID=UPI003D1AB203
MAFWAVRLRGRDKLLSYPARLLACDVVVVTVKTAPGRARLAVHLGLHLTVYSTRPDVRLHKSGIPPDFSPS